MPPSPTISCRSRLEPRSNFASFMWIRRRRSASSSSRSSCEQRLDALGLVERVAGREQVTRVEDEPEPLVVHGVEQRPRLAERRGDRPARAGHQLDQELGLVGRLGEGGLEHGRGTVERVGDLRLAARSRVDDEPARLEHAARRDRTPAELDRLREELRVRRRDVHEVRRVDEQRTDRCLAPLGAERLRGLQARTRPRPRVRDEELDHLGAGLAGERDRGAEPAPQVGADPHAT